MILIDCFEHVGLILLLFDRSTLQNNFISVIFDIETKSIYVFFKIAEEHWKGMKRNAKNKSEWRRSGEANRAGFGTL